MAEQQENAAVAEAVLVDGTEVVASLLFEPADWAITLYGCSQGDCSFLALAFMALPFASGRGGHLLDDGIDYALELTGQKHHGLSTKIIRALNEHITLRGVFQRDDLIFQAAELGSHRGYQTWHRAYDDVVVNWLRTVGSEETPRAFLSFLRDLHLSPDLQSRFPLAVQTIEEAIQRLP